MVCAQVVLSCQPDGTCGAEIPVCPDDSTEEPTLVIQTSCEDSGNDEEFIRCLQDRIRTLEEDVSNVRSQLSSMESSCGATLDDINVALSSCS